jgi:hypothetical protein
MRVLASGPEGGDQRAGSWEPFPGFRHGAVSGSASLSSERT